MRRALVYLLILFFLGISGFTIFQIVGIVRKNPEALGPIKLPWLTAPSQYYTESEESGGTEVGSERFATSRELAELQGWAHDYQIQLRGLKKRIRELYSEGFDENSDSIPLAEVPGVAVVLKGIRRIPWQAMVPMRGKTLYISVLEEPPHIIIKGNLGGVLPGVEDGIVLTQPITTISVVHQFGHIVGFFGIEGLYGSNYPNLVRIRADYDAIFETTDAASMTGNIPIGYMTLYAMKNKAENFTEHFTAYLVDGEEFRRRASSNAKLMEKYGFLKRIFEGEEF
jgi:hypothetical protein